MRTPTGQPAANDTDRELYDRARAWMWEQGESSWVADAFGHWVITEVAPRGPLPPRFSNLCAEWHYDPIPRGYRARHGARLSGSPPWAPGDPLPEPASDDAEVRDGDDDAR